MLPPCKLRFDDVQSDTMTLGWELPLQIIGPLDGYKYARAAKQLVAELYTE